MVLVIGGFAQGKRDYVKARYGVRDEDISQQLADQRVVYALHEIVRKLADYDRAADVVLAHMKTHPETIYICDEVGCGVIPVEPDERAWREAVGRVCVMLAEHAQRVERVFCGISMILLDRDGGQCG